LNARNPFARSGLTVVAVLALAVAAIAVRVFSASGAFSSVKPGFSGTCESRPVAGVGDMEIDAADRLAFLAVIDARHPGPRDGIYMVDLSGAAKPVRLAGTPPDFHPRGIGLYRTSNGGLFLGAVNHHGINRFSIDMFEVTRKNGTRSLAAISTVEGGPLIDPQDVAVTGPNGFYVSNGVTAKNAVMRALQSYGVLSGGDIVYFNGTYLREVVNGLSGPRGLALTPDGNHLLVADVTGRNLVSLSREPFTGNLSEAGQLALPSGPDRLALDGNTLWVAGHADLFAWRSFGRDANSRAPSQIFRVTLAGGVPQSAGQVYGSDGSQIAGAAVGAALGKRLLIGSPLDARLLDCRLP
jgi:hypothetical protein